MEQEQTNKNAVSTKDTKTPIQLGPGQALLAYGSRECDQFFHEVEDRYIVRRPAALTKFFTDLDRQVYSLACGGLHTVLLTTNGEVYTFGCNDDGALGRTGDEMQPGKVDLEHPMDMIAAGDSHSIACNSAHSIVFHWGVYRNTNKGNISKSETPHRIGEDEFRKKKVKKILSGANHTLALVDGKVYAWGDAEVGILGRMPTSRRKLDQGLKIEGMGVKGVVEDIYTGAYHAFLKKTEKKKQESYSAIYAWGLNNNGQLGLGHAENTHIPAEVTVLRGMNIKNITGGEHHTVALTEEGEVYCFGKNDDGQVGLGKDFEEKEESESEDEQPAENKKTPVKPAKPPAKSTSKKGKGKGKKGSQKKGDAVEEDKGEEQAEEKEGAEKKDEEQAKDEKAETKTETTITETTDKKVEDKGAEVPAAAEPEKTEAKDKASEKKEKEAEAEEAEQTKKSVFQSVKKPHKVELTNVEKIFSGSNFNYAVTKENDIYSWGMGENYVLGTKSEDAVYVPTKLDANLFEGKKIAVMGLGAQHVIVLAVDKGDKDPEIDTEAIAKIEEAGKSSKKGTTAKKGEKKGRGAAKKDEEEENDKEVKKDLSKELEEEHEDKDEKKGQKKSLKRKATGEKEEEEGVKKVKKSPSKEKETSKKTEEKTQEKMEEEKPEQEKADKGTIEKEGSEAQKVEEKKDENAKPAEEAGKMEVEQTDKKEEKTVESTPTIEEGKKIETEEPSKEATAGEERSDNREAQVEAVATENKAAEEKTA